METRIEKYISLKHILIHGKKYIGLQYYADKVINALIKELPNRKWSEKYKMVVVPNTKEHLDAIFNAFRGVVWVNTTHFFNNKPSLKNTKSNNLDYYRNRKILDGQRTVPVDFIDKLEIKRYALNTCKTYISNFEKFMNAFPDTDLNMIQEQDIVNYHLKLTQNGLSYNAINQSINSVKFYYETVLNMPNRFYKLDRPIKKQSLPIVLSKKEVDSILKSLINVKHKTIITLLYSSGMRISELLQLKPEDIDSERMLIHVKDAKGNKDRYTLLSKRALSLLRVYYREFKPESYLFEGADKGNIYSTTSVAKIIKRSVKKCNIKKRVTAHTFRHSFATHLLESGVDLRYIQTILGHNSSKTTEIYTKVALNIVRDIKNPLD